jgi:hypothetical protein
MDFAIMLSAPASTTIQIDYRTKDLPLPVTTTTGNSTSAGTTTTSGSGVATNSPAVPRAIARKDYLPEKGTLVIKAGETRGDIRVNVLADDLQEADELFNLVLSNARGVALDASNSKSLTLTGTIQDHAYPVLSAQAPSCLEGTRSSGNSDMIFTLTLSETSRYPVSLKFATGSKTATDLTGALQKKDFQPVSGKLTFSPGETIKYIHVPIVPDRIGEPSETVRLVLDKLVGADFPASTASAATPVASQPQLVIIGTILDDEPTVIV